MMTRMNTPTRSTLVGYLTRYPQWTVFGVSVLVGLLLIAASQLSFSTAVRGNITDDMAMQGDVIMAPAAALETKKPNKIADLPQADTIAAAGMLVRDVESDTILYEKAQFGVRAMASITKLMTALTLLDIGLDWGGTGTVVADDGLIDNHMYAGDTYTTDELWLSMLVASSNKAAMTLVDMTAPNREYFVARMNAIAADLGMTDTTFVEPTGLNAGNVSTPKDISILLDRALSEPAIRDGLRTTEYQLYSNERETSHHMWNTNWLLLDWIPNNFYYVIGGKTGYIDASLYNFTTRIVTVDGKILDVVVLGAPSHEERFTIARDAVYTALRSYDWGGQIQE